MLLAAVTLASSCASSSEPAPGYTARTDISSTEALDEQLGSPDDLEILAIGDSIFEWNGTESIPAVVGRELRTRGYDVSVVNLAVSGACLVECNGLRAIGDTYVPRAWDIVIIDGGANDVGSSCNEIEHLVNASLDAGEMVDLLDRISAGGASIVLYGYSRSLDANARNFGNCASFDELNRRYQAVATERDDVEFFDAEAVTRRDPSMYSDQVHPSVAGSEAIGEAMAELVEVALLSPEEPS